MPDVFERFFADFDKKPSDYYQLERLNPGYQVVFENGKKIQIGDNLEEIYEVFEAEEKGASVKLQKFIKEARDNYKVAIEKLVYKPGLSPLELCDT